MNLALNRYFLFKNNISKTY